MSHPSYLSWTARLFTTLAAGALLAFGPAASAQNTGTIEMEVYKAGFIIGGSGGSGTLHYGGRSYPLSIGGVSLGATIGFSKAQLVGEVRNIRSANDIEGVYTAAGAGVAVAGGPKVAELKNSKGVELSVKGQQVGLEFSLDLSGMEIKLKN
jgi:lipid-binding SYLF domain-containing protein